LDSNLKYRRENVYYDDDDNNNSNSSSSNNHEDGGGDDDGDDDNGDGYSTASFLPDRFLRSDNGWYVGQVGNTDSFQLSAMDEVGAEIESLRY
jgi:hypothetical protein